MQIIFWRMSLCIPLAWRDIESSSVSPLLTSAFGKWASYWTVAARWYPELLKHGASHPLPFLTPPQLFVRSLGAVSHFQSAGLGEKSFLGKAIKQVVWADLKKLGQQGGASPEAEVLLHSCIDFLWLPIEAASGSGPATKKRELHREENSSETSKVEVQPEKLQPAWGCSAS